MWVLVAGESHICSRYIYLVPTVWPSCMEHSGRQGGGRGGGHRGTLDHGLNGAAGGGAGVESVSGGNKAQIIRKPGSSRPLSSGSQERNGKTASSGRRTSGGRAVAHSAPSVLSSVTELLLSAWSKTPTKKTPYKEDSRGS